MTPEQKVAKQRVEFMREQVIELELQARYWKAQWETKFYTLEDSKVKDEYNDFIKKTQEEYLNNLAEDRAKLEATQAVEPTLSTNV